MWNLRWNNGTSSKIKKMWHCINLLFTMEIVYHMTKKECTHLPLSFFKLPINLIFNYFWRENSKRLSYETLPFYYWTENDKFKEGSLDWFDIIPGQVDSEQADEGVEEDGPATNPLRLHRLMRNQRERVAHFVSGRAFLPARNERTVRQQHHCPRVSDPPPSGFLFSVEEENE